MVDNKAPAFRRGFVVGLCLAFGLLALFGGAGQVRAEEPRTVCPICSKAGNQSAGYGDHAVHTLGRGAVNTLFGWTEMLRQPTETAKEGGNVATGIGRGIGQSVTRTLAGVGEVLTFWSPKTKDGYVNFAHDCPICLGKKKP